MKSRPSLPLESVLRSPVWRPLIVLGIVVALSFAVSVPRAEIAELRGRSVDRVEVFFWEMIRWGVWALAAWPIGALARWILSRSGSWLILLVLQVPLAAGTALGFLHLDDALHPGPPATAERSPDLGPDRFRGPEGRPRRAPNNGQRGEFRPRRGRGPRSEAEGPSLDSPFWRFRWLQSMLVYWVVLLMGGSLRSFLELRDKERRSADLELRAERLRAQLASAQLATLKGQLNPHFLFNALHTVGGLIRAGEEQTALKTLAAVGDLLRATLDQGDAEELTLGAELEIVQRYLDIERIRLGDRLQVEWDIEAGLDEAWVPALFLLPLVENSVRHGLSNLPEGGRVSVRARRAGSSLRIEVCDDGIGFPPEVLGSGAAKPSPERRPIGLENTRARLQALYAEAQSFELSAGEPRGARLRIELPYHEESLAQGPLQ